MSRTSRAALVVFAAVLAVLIAFHVFAPQMAASLAQTIHGR